MLYDTKTILIGSDHGGFEMKKELIEYLTSKIDKNSNDIEIIDIGTNSNESCDYPDIAKQLCTHQKLDTDTASGILICGTGIGISIAANKYSNIRCALCHNEYTVKMTRNHNNANILALGARVINIEIAKKIVDIFFTENFEGGRHKNRIDKIL